MKGRWCGTENGELRLELGERKKSFWMMGGGGAWCERDRIRVSFFFQNCPPPFLCVLKATICRQNIVWSPNFVPRLLLFCKF